MDWMIRLWSLEMGTLLRAMSAPARSYTTAKMVLVGDSGVGKSGLGLVLAGQPFEPTESTHGRRIWRFEQREVTLPTGEQEQRETWLWDLAGQPGYRLIHQLHLNEVALALLVFDARSETDPFAGIQYWERALHQAQRLQGDAIVPLKKFLVAARADRGGIAASRERIEALVRELGFDGSFETSAREGWQIAELRAALREAINWEAQPKVSSTELFQDIQAFLIAEKTAGRLLSTRGDLYRTFLRSRPEPTDLQATFTTCIGRVEAAGLIKQLSFGNLVLLQPELLDASASALINAVKDEPDGLGSIAEDRVRRGDFRMPVDERLTEKLQEHLLLIAMVEDLLRRELALREEPFLVFPSQSTREHPDLPDPEGRTVVFTFEGPVLNLYATLAVRLSNSGIFKMKALWKNAIEYTANAGGTCGMFLRNTGEGRGELTLFFDEATREETRFYFEEFVRTHLERRALPETIQRRRIFVCRECGAVVTEQIVRIRQERGFDWLNCSACDAHISLADREERLQAAPSPRVLAMDRAADQQRDWEVAKSTAQGKEAAKDFDVFLCYHAEDRSAVKRIGEQLKEQGILPWFDVEQLQPGFPWQHLLEQQIAQIKAAAVFVGKPGISPWKDMELRAFLAQFVKRECPVIPVILPDCEQRPDLPPFLEGMTWVDFREREPDPMESLIWGITGQHL